MNKKIFKYSLLFTFISLINHNKAMNSGENPYNIEVSGDSIPDGYARVTYGQVATGIALDLGLSALRFGGNAALVGASNYGAHKAIENIDKIVRLFGYTTKVKEAAIPKKDEKLAYLPGGAIHYWKGCIKRRLEKKLSWMELIAPTKEDRSWDVGYQLKPGIVLYGPPGTGKTTAAKELARKLQIPFIRFSGTDFSTEVYIGSAQKPVRDAISELNTFVERNGDCVCLIDEADSIGSREDKRNHANFNVINMFLEAIPDTLSSKVHLVLATNYLERIDPGLFRDGRLERQRLDYPATEERMRALKLRAKNYKLYQSAFDYLVGELAEKTAYFTYAELADLINMSARNAEIDIAYGLKRLQRQSRLQEENENSEKKKENQQAQNPVLLKAITKNHLIQSLITKARSKEMAMRSQLAERVQATHELTKIDDEFLKEEILKDVEHLKEGVTMITRLAESLNKEKDDPFLVINESEQILGSPKIKGTPWYKKLLTLTVSTLNSKSAYFVYGGLGITTALYLNQTGFWNQTIMVPIPTK